MERWGRVGGLIATSLTATEDLGDLPHTTEFSSHRPIFSYTIKGLCVTGQRSCTPVRFSETMCKRVYARVRLTGWGGSRVVGVPLCDTNHTRRRRVGEVGLLETPNNITTETTVIFASSKDLHGCFPLMGGEGNQGMPGQPERSTIKLERTTE